jgi:hypothetical protein
MSNAKDNQKKSRPAKAPKAKTTSKVKAAAKRLRPGELDGLVLGYLGKHKEDGPLTPGAIAKGLERSSGAVANCLARQAKSKAVRLTKTRPRSYVIHSGHGLRVSLAR